MIEKITDLEKEKFLIGRKRIPLKGNGEKKPKVEKSLITLSLTSLRPSSNGIIFQINDSQVVALPMNLQYKISSHVALCP